MALSKTPARPIDWDLVHKAMQHNARSIAQAKWDDLAAREAAWWDRQGRLARQQMSMATGGGGWFTTSSTSTTSNYLHDAWGSYQRIRHMSLRDALDIIQDHVPGDALTKRTYERMALRPVDVKPSKDVENLPAVQTRDTINDVAHSIIATIFGSCEKPLLYAKDVFPKGATVVQPDGSKLDWDTDGNLQVSDYDAKIIYKANPVRNFNRFLNASDLLEHFIEDAGKAGVRQEEFLNLPVEIFINWLIMRAAVADGDAIPEDVKPPEQHPKAIPYRGSPRCLSCGRFIKDALAAAKINWCNEQHLLIYMEKRGLAHG